MRDIEFTDKSGKKWTIEQKCIEPDIPQHTGKYWDDIEAGIHQSCHHLVNGGLWKCESIVLLLIKNDIDIPQHLQMYIIVPVPEPDYKSYAQHLERGATHEFGLCDSEKIAKARYSIPPFPKE